MTKRSHVVPAVYQRAWATDSQVAVRRRDKQDVFDANVLNVAAQKHIYGTGEDLERREQHFQAIENMWPALRLALVGRGGLLRRPDRDAAALFMAFQLGRGTDRMAQFQFFRAVAALTEKRPVPREVIRGHLRETHLRFEPEEHEVEAAWQFANFALAQPHELPTEEEEWSLFYQTSVQQVAPLLASLHWSVEISTRPILHTSDRPVMCWRPPSPRDAYEGVGPANCTEIRVPLTPWALLVMRRTGLDMLPATVDAKRFRDVNTGVASQCQDLVIARPDQRRRLEALILAPHRPTLRFSSGAGTEQLPDGSRREVGEVLHTWSPAHV